MHRTSKHLHAAQVDTLKADAQSARLRAASDDLAARARTQEAELNQAHPEHIGCIAYRKPASSIPKCMPFSLLWLS